MFFHTKWLLLVNLMVLTVLSQRRDSANRRTECICCLLCLARFSLCTSCCNCNCNWGTCIAPPLEDRGCITESIRVLVPIDRMKQKCFHITTSMAAVSSLRSMQLHDYSFKISLFSLQSEVMTACILFQSQDRYVFVLKFSRCFTLDVFTVYRQDSWNMFCCPNCCGLPCSHLHGCRPHWYIGTLYMV